MVVLFIALLGVWVVFSGFLSAKFIIMGVVSCLIAVWVSTRMRRMYDQKLPLRAITARSIIYWPWLAKEIWNSSVGVAITVWQTGGRVEPVMQPVDGTPDSDLGRALYANTITLTPGTLCVDVDNEKVTVHALSESGIADLQQGDMRNKVGSFIRERK